MQLVGKKLGATAPAVALAARKNSTKTNKPCAAMMAAVAWPCGGNGSVCAHMPI